MRMNVVIMGVLSVLSLLPPAFRSQTPSPAPAQAPAAQEAAPQAQPPAAPPQAASSQPAGKERFRGTIVNQGGPGSRFFLGGWFTLVIDQYTSDQEALVLANALKAGGQKALMDKVWKLKQIGYFKVENSMGYPLYVARSKQTPAGRIIRCITNRPIAPRELNLGTRSLDYAFGYIEIFIPTEGKGNGTVIGAASLGFTGANTITVESYGLMPIQLMDVAVEKSK